MSEKTDQIIRWIEKADHDLGTAIITHRYIPKYPDTIAFHCQQAVEKSFKAVLEEHGKAVPRVHDLNTLHSQVEEYVEFEVDSDILKQLNELYIDSRYPSDLGLLPGGKPPKELSQKMHSLAQEVYDTIDKGTA